jgi:NH3-dependent NAD+ synthetase
MTRRKQVLSIAAVALIALALLSATACKTSGMAVTSRGQVLKLHIAHPEDLPENGVDNLDITISNLGVNNIQNILLEVELPPQLVVLDQTNDRGVDVIHSAGSNMYRFTFGNIQAGERSQVRFRVRTMFGTMSKTDSVKATAWQEGLPGDKLIETAEIRLRE